MLENFVSTAFKKLPKENIYSVLTHNTSYIIPCKINENLDANSEAFTINFLEDQNSDLATKKIDFFASKGINHYVGKLRKQMSTTTLKNMKIVSEREDILGEGDIFRP